MASQSPDALYLINKISAMPAPIRVDGKDISGDEFRDIAVGSMQGVSGKNYCKTITGDPRKIPEVLGLIVGGAKVLAMPDFFDGRMVVCLTEDFLNASDDIPNGTITSVSSGTSGFPKLNVVKPYFDEPSMIDAMADWSLSRFGTMHEGRAFMTAPLQTTILSYIAALGLGIPLSMTTERTSPESISKHVGPEDTSIMTKGSMVTKLYEAGFRHQFEYFLSASSPLGPDAVAHARKVFCEPEIVDVYSCTEAGILGARKIDEPFFLMTPMVSPLSESSLHSEMVVGTITDSGLEKKDFVDTGDRVNASGRLVELIGRGKAKVSGFSVFPAEVFCTLRDSGFMVESVYVDEGLLVCAHRGTFDEERATRVLEDRGLPFYSIPKRYVSVV